MSAERQAADRRLAIGIDVGGTKIAAGLIDLDGGRVVACHRVPTDRAAGGEAVLQRVRDCVAMLDAVAGNHQTPVGVGVPELVANDGAIASTWNFDWRGLDPARQIAPGRVARIECDVRAAALGELHYGAGRGLESFVYITMGTGMSYVLCVGGRLHRGARGFAIHFASADLQPVCRACGHQGKFNLEGFASGDGLRTEYQRRSGRLPADASEIIEARGDAVADLLFEQATTALAAGLGQMVDMLDPHAIILGGGIAGSRRWVDAVRGRLPGCIWAEGARAVPLLVSGLGADSGMIGAAAAAVPPL